MSRVPLATWASADITTTLPSTRSTFEGSLMVEPPVVALPRIMGRTRFILLPLLLAESSN